MSNQTIAVDIDDVLAQHAEAFVLFSNQNYGTNITTAEYDSHWSKIWGVDKAEIDRRALEFHTTESILAYGKIEDAEPVLAALRANYNLVIVTARPKHAVQVTHQWLEQHFPGVFSAVHFVPIWEVGNTVTKADICKEIGADYLLDDVPMHCNTAAQCGVGSLLFGDYPWNEQSVLPEGVVRCADWSAVLEYFDGQR
jgi:5'(3')-deoxyribonucleotidase